MSDPVTPPPQPKQKDSACFAIARQMNYCLGNALECIWQAGIKGCNTIENLLQARFYIDQELARQNNEAAKEKTPAIPKASLTVQAAPSPPHTAAHASGNKRRKPKPRILSDEDKETIVKEAPYKTLNQVVALIGKPLSAVKNTYYTARNSSMAPSSGTTTTRNGIKVTTYPPGYGGGIGPSNSVGRKG